MKRGYVIVAIVLVIFVLFFIGFSITGFNIKDFSSFTKKADFEIVTKPIEMECKLECPNGFITDENKEEICECVGSQITRPANSCLDTDKGLDYFNRGCVSVSPSISRPVCDSCSGDILKEYYCKQNTIQSQNYECANGCEDGACVEEECPDLNCELPDCENGYEVDENGCEICECLERETYCIDSDGLDKYTTGKIRYKESYMNNGRIHYDNCRDITSVIEYYCDGDSMESQPPVDCSSEGLICLNGRCLDENIIELPCEYGDSYRLGYLEYFNTNLAVKEETLLKFNDREEYYFWCAINELEETGKLFHKMPLSLEECYLEGNNKCNYYGVDLSYEEAYYTYAGKVAFSIWLDKNNLLSWKLSDYGKKELNYLFSPDSYFRTYDPSDSFVMVYPADYSSYEVFNYFNEYISDSKESTAFNILESLRDFRHAIVGMGDLDNNVKTLIDILTYYDENGKRISNDCHTVTRYTRGALASVNIPSYSDFGWYGGAGHSSLFIPPLEEILIHGDDLLFVYDNIPIEELLMDQDYFKEHVLPCGKNTECAEYETLRFYYLLILDYPTHYILDKCCTGGEHEYMFCWNYLVTQQEILSYITEEELEEGVLNILESCEESKSLSEDEEIPDSPQENPTNIPPTPEKQKGFIPWIKNLFKFN